MSGSPAEEVESIVSNRFPERCVLCADWVYPTWTVTWVGGRTEILCGIHGDPVDPAKLS